ncbi:unnamed protein product [Effrenium voratum]|nr:unnamed protein product [Effrenium voratum]
MSAWMETAVQCIQWSCKCILETPSLYLLPPVTLSARGLLVAGHIYVGAMLSSAGISKYKWIVSYSADSTWASAMLELSPVQWACFFGTIFMGIWAQGIVTAWTIFVTDYTSQMWYFSGGMSNKGSAPMLSVARAGWLGIRYHAGSMIGGGLKLMIALPWRISLGWLEETTKNQYNPVGAILGGCCDCFLHFYRRFFHVMSRHAFLDVSLQASPFDEAARHALSVLESESSAVSVLNGATWTFQIVGLGTIASIGHLVTTFEIQSRPELHSIQSPNYVQQPELLCMAGAVLAFAVAFPFMMMFDVVSDSILFCRSVQKMRHQANKPGVSAMMPDLDRACGPTNGMISRIVGCYCAGRDRQAEDWGLLSNMSWNSTSDTASPPRSRPQDRRHNASQQQELAK